MSSIIGKECVDFIGNAFDKLSQEVASRLPCGLLNKAGEDELGCAINGYKEVEFTLLGVNLGQINMEVSDGIRFELLLFGRVDSFHLRQTVDDMSLEAAMKSRTAQLGNACLQGIKTVIKRQQGKFTKGYDDSFLFRSECC